MRFLKGLHGHTPKQSAFLIVRTVRRRKKCAFSMVRTVITPKQSAFLIVRTVRRCKKLRFFNGPHCAELYKNRFFDSLHTA